MNLNEKLYELNSHEITAVKGGKWGDCIWIISAAGALVVAAVTTRMSISDACEHAAETVVLATGGIVVLSSIVTLIASGRYSYEFNRGMREKPLQVNID